MSSQAGPPARPPQVSPDGKWYWDGAQWRPFAVHQAIFPTWQSVGAGLPPESAARVQRIPSPPPPSRPASIQPPRRVYRAAPPPPAPQLEAPLWKQPASSTGVTKLMYLGAGFIALIVVGVVLSSLGTIRFPWEQSPPEQVAAKAVPALSARSDSARADHLVTVVLAPPLATLSDSVTLVRESCPAGMTASCQDALVQVDNNVTALLPVIDHETVPLCIAPQVAQLRADLVKLDGDAQLGVKGFKDDRAGEVSSGASLVSSLFGQVQADSAAIPAAAKGCDTQIVGP